MTTTFRQLTNEFDTLVSRAMRQGYLDPTDFLDIFEQLDLLAASKADKIRALAFHLQNIPTEFFSCTETTLVYQLNSLPYEPLSNGSAFRTSWLSENEHLALEMPFGKVSVLHFTTHLSFLSHYYLETLEESGSPGGIDSTPVKIEKVADSLGLTAEELTNLYDGTSGLLERLLHGELSFPEIHIHASLNPATLQRTVSEHTSKLVQELAEAGLGNRDLHLWFGNDLPTYFLSPFIRDMENHFESWVEANLEHLGPDLQNQPYQAQDPDFTMGVALDFLGTDEHLLNEVQEANTKTGISHHQLLGQPYEIIDCSRLDYSALDPRIRPQNPTSESPVILRLPHLLEDERGELLRTLSRLATNRIQSVSIAMGGTHLGHSPGSLLICDLALRWEGEKKIAFPARSALSRSFPDNAGGVLLTGPCGPLLSGAHLKSLSKELRIAGVTLGFGGLLEAMADCLWSGLLKPTTKLHWPLLSQMTLPSGRPDLDSLRGWSQIIANIVGPILSAKAEVAQEPIQKKEPPPAPKPQKRKKAAQPMSYQPPSTKRIQDLSGGPVLPPPGYEGNQPSLPQKPHNGRKLRIKA